MAAPKAKGSTNGLKREHAPEKGKDRPSKKTKLLDDSDDEASEDGDAGEVALQVNEEFAKRFEHNKKREEQHRLEEKYGKSKALQDEDDPDDSEEGVEEDDAGELITDALDEEISATLQALRSKDPRIYDSTVNFFHASEEEGQETTNGTKKDEGMTLRQFHTKNLLEGKFNDEDEDVPRQTYAQEQEAARQALVSKAKAVEDDDDEDDFLVAKSRSEPAPKDRVKVTAADVENADKDPETFLSNFMASRAWVPKGNSFFQPLESDDSEEEAAADEYENSYNMYFEDTTGANEKIVTYARDAVAKTTVRREEKNSRKKARDAARAKREAERQQKEEDLARLRKLKVDEMEEKVRKIRETGGLKGRDFKLDEWKDVLEGDWSDDQWDREMQKRFGDAYYDDDDAGMESGDEHAGKSKKPKKPKFDDDIDIKDLIPDFEDDGEEPPQFSLTDDEDADVAADEEEDDAGTSAKSKSSKQRKQERAEVKSAARRDRRLIETLVDQNLQYEATLAASSSKAPSRFRYRETSPTTFGMTARDILLASDKQLNEFAGLKKLATFRDPAKKKKDKKQLSKKARLRQWRQETFGDPDGPKGGFETILGDDDGAAAPVDGTNTSVGAEGDDGVNIRGEGKRKRKRKGKKHSTDA